MLKVSHSLNTTDYAFIKDNAHFLSKNNFEVFPMTKMEEHHYDLLLTEFI